MVSRVEPQKSPPVRRASEGNGEKILRSQGADGEGDDGARQQDDYETDDGVDDHIFGLILLSGFSHGDDVADTRDDNDHDSDESHEGEDILNHAEDCSLEICSTASTNIRYLSIQLGESLEGRAAGDGSEKGCSEGRYALHHRGWREEFNLLLYNSLCERKCEGILGCNLY